MNTFEFGMMNNALWWHLQSMLIAGRWAPQKALVFPGGQILEIGCGSGHGALVLRDMFSPAEIHAIDLDERMIGRAKQFESDAVHFEVGDAARCGLRTVRLTRYLIRACYTTFLTGEIVYMNCTAC